MTRRRNTILVLILVLMSQSIAVASTVCPMMLNMANPSTNMMDMDHSSHGVIDSQEITQSGASSCCDGSDCEMMGCVPAYLPSNMQLEPSVYNLFIQQEYYNSYVLWASPTSLFRPPII